MEAPPIHKLTHEYIGTLRSRRYRPLGRFCYDKSVWSARTGRQAGMFLRHVVPAVVKPARTLWNEVIGFIFLCIAGLLAINGVRAWMHHDLLRILVAVFGALFLGSFGVGSFRRARKISRS